MKMLNAIRQTLPSRGYTPGPLTAVRRRAARFAADETGTLGVFAVMMMFWMIALAGIAVDVMHHEQIRTQMQQTLDRSVLAAASLSQTLNAEDVVSDYFDKAGLSDQLSAVSVEQGLNFREVTATAEADTNPYFLDLYGHSELVAAAAGIAEQRISNVEISLVLDVSRSMVEYPNGDPLPSPNRLDNLKVAATDFAHTVLGDSPNDLISISLVPYNAHVNLGPTLFAEYRTNYNFTFPTVSPKVWCIDIPLSSYAQTGVSPTTTFPQGGFFDAYSSTSTYNSFTERQPPLQRWDGYYLNVACQPIPGNYVRPYMNDADDLEDEIDLLFGMGGTAIDKGMKWGMALLDPSARPVVSGLIADGHVDASFAGRPVDHNDGETMKVIVLMTDGENFEGERLNNGYRGDQLSQIYRSNGDGRLSIRHQTGRPASAGTNQYWWPHECVAGYTGWSYSSCATRGAWKSTIYNSGSGTTRLTWAQVWQEARMQWVAWQLYARALGTSDSDRSDKFTTWMNNFRAIETVTNRNDSLQQLCTLAKNSGVIVFGIAFHAPDSGAEQIQRCATEGNFFRSTGLNIRSDFQAIASQISNLRLTQ
jgi:Flp pilus assembly protein TadG